MDAESRLHDQHHEALRLWLRLLTCTQLIERRVRGELRARYGTTLPRFDLMAQLERHPQGLKMKELSQRLMVTGGNVTGITDQLCDEGLVERCHVPEDRRVWRVRLTEQGRRVFAEMAAAHEQWIVDCFAALDGDEQDQLHRLLGAVKAQVRALDVDDAADAPGTDAPAPQAARRARPPSTTSTPERAPQAAASPP
jgi:DNA-binding MarR family transcriptional regulator